MNHLQRFATATCGVCMQVALITENIDLRGVKSFHEYRSYYTILTLCTASKMVYIYIFHDVLFIYLFNFFYKKEREKTLDKLL